MESLIASLLIVFGGLAGVLRVARDSWTDIDLRLRVWKLVSLRLRASDADDE